MNYYSNNSFRSAFISWLILSALLFWFKGGVVPVLVAVIGSVFLVALSRLAPTLLMSIAKLTPSRLTLLLMTGMVCAIVGEFVIARVARQLQVYGWASRDTFEIHPTRWFAHKAHLDVVLTAPDYSYRLQTNSLGFRDSEHDDVKADAVTRILLIGDSFTDGDGVAVEDSYPAVMKRQLEADSDTVLWEIINVSVPGYGPIETALTLDEFGPRYRPDLIIFGLYLGNDLHDAMKSRDEKLHEIGLIRDDIPIFPLNNWLWHKSNFYVLLQHALSVIEEKINGSPTEQQLGLTGVSYFKKDAPKVYELGWRRTSLALARMKSLSDSLGSELLVAVFPLPSQVTPRQYLKYYPEGLDLSDTTRYDVSWLQHSAHAKLDSLGIAYIDLTDSYRAAPNQPLFNTKADHHPNRSGYMLMGESIAKAVKKWRAEKVSTAN